MRYIHRETSLEIRVSYSYRMFHLSHYVVGIPSKPYSSSLLKKLNLFKLLLVRSDS